MWLCANKLSLNVKKTNYCIFHSPACVIPENCDSIKIGCKQIERVQNVKYLGLIIDEKLNWKSHTHELTRNLIKTASTLKFIRNHVPNQCKLQLYYAYAYSKLIYGIEVYGNTSKTITNKLQVFQNRILKILYKVDWYTNTNLLHKTLSVLKLTDTRNLFIVKFVHRCKTGDISNVFKDYFTTRNKIHDKNTRNAYKYDIPSFRTTNYGQKTIKYLGAKLYNNLPKYITSFVSMNTFNKNVKYFYLSQY